MAKQSSLSDYPKGLSRIVGMGLSSMVLSLDDFTVLKHPLSEYHYGANFRSAGELPPIDNIFRWSIHIAEGIQYLHSNCVFQLDIGCHNVLIDENNNAKLSDFAGSKIDDGKVEVAPGSRACHPDLQKCLKPTVQTEIFGLESVLFELCTTNQPYHNIEDHEVDVLFRDGIFPDTTNLPLGEIVLKCWTGKYASGREVATDVEQIQNKYHGDQKAGLKSSNEKHYYQ
ncbi:hypothetical protein LOZ12_003549 [Ophidiomyces ophidiicola]|uniref:Uncharacterized protein n=1 Tax=Ophidiomyces ophidiicola TaxID=1387563 RepID=A0ACB8UVB5_9EURO|nr:hypothetical protein LOZ62_003971 [Ophidiomyces ophidiicola]KAI1971142.1 hypothetical protein LOZ56_003211 [Ophidiomyces ophidiicola]KAI2016948.1 hypothetical protein LOZ46_004715 [Ophidiomyces ophidiicola]KAI2050167.1 hypothetical protein LOZ38_003391 [Ophidiomyces ophidiicola]KAI2078193.1 hypothetical protein LOZ37_002455 [Ophidiomyces ophidiicola]